MYTVWITCAINNLITDVGIKYDENLDNKSIKNEITTQILEEYPGREWQQRRNMKTGRK